MLGAFIERYLTYEYGVICYEKRLGLYRIRFGVDDLVLLGGAFSAAAAPRDHAVVLAHAVDKRSKAKELRPVERLPGQRERYHPDHEYSATKAMRVTVVTPASELVAVAWLSSSLIQSPHGFFQQMSLALFGL